MSEQNCTHSRATSRTSERGRREAPLPLRVFVEVGWPACWAVQRAAVGRLGSGLGYAEPKGPLTLRNDQFGSIASILRFPLSVRYWPKAAAINVRSNVGSRGMTGLFMLMSSLA